MQHSPPPCTPPGTRPASRRELTPRVPRPRPVARCDLRPHGGAAQPRLQHHRDHGPRDRRLRRLRRAGRRHHRRRHRRTGGAGDRRPRRRPHGRCLPRPPEPAQRRPHGAGPRERRPAVLAGRAEPGELRGGPLLRAAVRGRLGGRPAAHPADQRADPGGGARDRRRAGRRFAPNPAGPLDAGLRLQPAGRAAHGHPGPAGAVGRVRALRPARRPGRPPPGQQPGARLRRRSAAGAPRSRRADHLRHARAGHRHRRRSGARRRGVPRCGIPAGTVVPIVPLLFILVVLATGRFDVHVGVQRP